MDITEIASSAPLDLRSPHMVTHRHRKARSLLAAVTAALIAMVGLATAPAAHAVYLGCGPTELTFVQFEGCTKTGIVKADGALLTRSQLMDNLAFYEAEGFDADFIEQAPEYHFTVDATTTWSGCRNNGTDGLCQPAQGEELLLSRLADLFPIGTPVTAIGGPDKWIALMCGNFHPVAIPGADSAKVGFTIVDPPTRIDADTDVPITVRATVVNHGPAQSTDVIDVIDATGPADCTITPSSVRVPLTLSIEQPITFDTPFVVRCTEPSNHLVRFIDTLESEVGRYDPNPTNNTRTADLAVEVFDDSDISVTDAALACSDQTEVGVPFDCVGSALVTNLGPYGPTETTSTLSLTGPQDCTITPTTGSALADTPLAVGAQTGVTQDWSVVCSARSFHPMAFTAEAAVTHLHVEDHVAANDAATAADVVEVFEDVDLEATLDHLACSEREANLTSSVCTATFTVTNNGPADDVVTDTDVTFAGENGCLITPTGTQTTEIILGAGESQTVTTNVTITCPTARRHVVRVVGDTHNSVTDPHAVDSDADSGIWVPTDVKPRSYPSSVNLDKKGTLPFAILGTAEFNPLTAVNTASLTIGVDGDEHSLIRCAAQGEDVNGDGYLDLICLADTTLTEVACTTTHLEIRGTLLDGTPLFGQDEVHVTGCRN